MFEESEIEIPAEVPVMTLDNTVLFPHAILPLYIFEERYRRMLTEALNSHRLIAIFNRLPGKTDDELDHYPVGTIGVIRASHENADGTSNLVLQGLSRVRFVKQVQQLPFPLVRINTIEEDSVPAQCATDRDKVLDLLESHDFLTSAIPDDYLNFLKSIKEADVFLDVSAFALVTPVPVRQRLLEISSLKERYMVLEQYLLKEVRRQDLYSELQGDTRDDEIELN